MLISNVIHCADIMNLMLVPITSLGQQFSLELFLQILLNRRLVYLCSKFNNVLSV